MKKRIKPRQILAAVAVCFFFCELFARNNTAGLFKAWELAAGAGVILLFIFEPQLIRFEARFAARCRVWIHNIKAATVRCFKRSKRFMAWLNDTPNISEQLAKESNSNRVELYDDWRGYKYG